MIVNWRKYGYSTYISFWFKNGDEWLVILNPETAHEDEIANCKKKDYAVAMCEGLKLEYTISE